MLVRLLEGMDRRRFDNTVVSLLRIDTFAPKLHKLGIRTETLDIRGGAAVISSAPRLIRLMKDVRPDLVQTWMSRSDLLGLFANRRAGCTAQLERALQRAGFFDLLAGVEAAFQSRRAPGVDAERHRLHFLSRPTMAREPWVQTEALAIHSRWGRYQDISPQF